MAQEIRSILCDFVDYIHKWEVENISMVSAMADPETIVDDFLSDYDREEEE